MIRHPGAVVAWFQDAVTNTWLGFGLLLSVLRCHLLSAVEQR